MACDSSPIGAARYGALADLTRDSDGPVEPYVDDSDLAGSTPRHARKPGDPAAGLRGQLDAFALAGGLRHGDGVGAQPFQPGLSMAEFMTRYATEAKCYRALYKWRRPNGFRCPACGASAAARTSTTRAAPAGIRPCRFRPAGLLRRLAVAMMRCKPCAEPSLRLATNFPG